MKRYIGIYLSLVKVISHLLPLPTEESSAGYTAAQMSSDCKNAKLLIKLKFAAPLGLHALLSPQSSGRECRGNTGLTHTRYDSHVVPGPKVIYA